MGDPRMADFMEDDYDSCEYTVLEMTLIDGKDQHARLIGVINDGDADCNSGFWGAIYLRPTFKEVGSIVSSGDTESTWEITDDTWYTQPSPALRRCGNELS